MQIVKLIFNEFFSYRNRCDSSKSPLDQELPGSLASQDILSVMSNLRILALQKKTKLLIYVTSPMISLQNIKITAHKL